MGEEIGEASGGGNSEYESSEHELSQTGRSNTVLIYVRGHTHTKDKALSPD